MAGYWIAQAVSQHGGVKDSSSGKKGASCGSHAGTVVEAVSSGQGGTTADLRRHNTMPEHRTGASNNLDATQGGRGGRSCLYIPDVGRGEQAAPKSRTNLGCQVDIGAAGSVFRADEPVSPAEGQDGKFAEVCGMSASWCQDNKMG